jgi:hypothetical protein
VGVLIIGTKALSLGKSGGQGLFFGPGVQPGVQARSPGWRGALGKGAIFAFPRPSPPAKDSSWPTPSLRRQAG